MNVEEGYGIVCSDIKWKKDVNQILINELIPQTTVIQERFKQWKENQRNTEDQDASEEDLNDLLTEEELNDIFIEEYDYGYSDGPGIETLIADLINELESLDIEITAFNFRNECLYVPASIPVNDHDKEKFLTQIEIQKILSKYMSLLAEEPVVIKWHTIREE